MASEPAPSGTLSVGVLDDNPIDDPWKRGYLKPPVCKDFSTETFPLVDVRSTMFPDGLVDMHSEAARALLRSHGFTVIKHASSSHTMFDFDDIDHLANSYYPEVERLVKTVTGARYVFFIDSIIRSSKKKGAAQVQERYQEQMGQSISSDKPNCKPVPTNQDQGRTASGSSNKRGAEENFPAKVNDTIRVFDPNEDLVSGNLELSLHIPSTFGIASANVPHIDYTALGARRAIRYQRLDLYATARESGIIDAEDQICAINGSSPIDASSEAILKKYYNRDGKLGPRYAGFTVWRPIRKVQCDPLAMLPSCHLSAETGSKYSRDGHRLVFWPYDIRSPGNPGLGGDFLRELAQIKVDLSESRAEQQEDPLPFYYVHGQEPDEVLLVKLFDTASFGRATEEADGPFHGSPDIGNYGGGDPRESIECRIIAIW